MCLQLAKVTAFVGYASSVSETDSLMVRSSLSITIGAVSFALQTEPLSLKAWSLKFSHIETFNKRKECSCRSMRCFNSSSYPIDCRKLPACNMFLHQYSDQLGIRPSAYAASLQHGTFCQVLYSPPLKSSSQSSPR